MDPLSPNPYAKQDVTPIVLPKQSKTSFIVAVVMTAGFIIALAFGIWSFIGMVESKSNLEDKISEASAVAVKETEQSKEAEFTEREKSPFKSYSGGTVFGSLSFSYPKSWSVYKEEGTAKDTLLDFYAHPDFVPSLSSDDSIVAFRVQLSSNEYATEAAEYVTDGENEQTFEVTAYQVSSVSGSEVGIRVAGEIFTDKTGVLVLIPIRDKTLKIWTESDQYLNDFEKILATVNFVP